MSPAQRHPRRALAASLAALGWGMLGAVLLPLLVSAATTACNSLTDACRRSPAGDCDMAAAVFSLMAAIPGSVPGAAAGIIQMPRRSRTD